MTAFLENSWLLWWLLAIVATLRWFHLLARRVDRDDSSSAPN
jgi:hypothetical protein